MRGRGEEFQRLVGRCQGAVVLAMRGLMTVRGVHQRFHRALPTELVGGCCRCDVQPSRRVRWTVFWTHQPPVTKFRGCSVFRHHVLRFGHACHDVTVRVLSQARVRSRCVFNVTSVYMRPLPYGPFAWCQCSVHLVLSVCFSRSQFIWARTWDFCHTCL